MLTVVTCVLLPRASLGGNISVVARNGLKLHQPHSPKPEDLSSIVSFPRYIPNKAAKYYSLLFLPFPQTTSLDSAEVNFVHRLIHVFDPVLPFRDSSDQRLEYLYVGAWCRKTKSYRMAPTVSAKNKCPL